MSLSDIGFLAPCMESGLVPVGAGGGMGWVGTLADVVSPGDRAPSSPPMEGRRATTREVVPPGDRAPRHIPPSPAPTDEGLVMRWLGKIYVCVMVLGFDF